MAMENSDKEILMENQVYLIEHLLMTDTFLASMRDIVTNECGSKMVIITDEMYEECTVDKLTRYQKVSRFLSILPKRGSVAFDTFIKALYISDQCIIAEKLTEKLTEKLIEERYKSYKNTRSSGKADIAYNKLTSFINALGLMYITVPKSQQKVPQTSVNYFGDNLVTSVNDISTNEIISVLSSVYSMDVRIDWSNMSKEQIESVYSKIRHELDAIKSFLKCLNNNGIKMVLNIQNDENNKIISVINYLRNELADKSIIEIDNNQVTISIKTFNIGFISDNNLDCLCLIIWCASNVRFIICKKIIDPCAYIYNGIFEEEELDGFVDKQHHIKMIMDTFNVEVIQELLVKDDDEEQPVKKIIKPWEKS